MRVEGRSRARHGDRDAQPQTAPPMHVLAEHISPALVQDVRLTNKLSMNLHAELLLRVAAREKGGAMTMDDALAFATAFRQSIGIVSGRSAVDRRLGTFARRPGDAAKRGATAEPTRSDSRGDLILQPACRWRGRTARSRIACAARRQPGRVHAKTGLVEHVNSLSGYATSRRGAHLIFAIFGNNTGTHGPEALHVVDAICVAMVEELAPHRESSRGTLRN